MDAFARIVSDVGTSVGIDSNVAGVAIGAILSAIMVWLGHVVSHSNAKIAATLQAAEKAAVIDIRNISLVTVVPDQWLRFDVRNFGATAATDVIVCVAKSAADADTDFAYTAVVAPTETIGLEFKLSTAIPADGLIVEVKFRDYRGRLCRQGRALSFVAPGGPPRQRWVRV